MTVDGALGFARTLGIERLDARVLLAHHLGHRREWLLAHGDEPIDEATRARFESDCRRRLDDVPLAYLTLTREFHGLTLEVDPAVLVPRVDTETLADWAIEVVRALLATTPRPRVIDLGTGSGALALAIAAAHPTALVTGTDASEAALVVASRNAQRLGLSVQWRQGDWWGAVTGERFDLAISNPPYIAADDPHLHALRHEPRQALVAADNGLAALTAIVARSQSHLSGWLLLEHGWNQAAAVHRLLLDAGMTRTETRLDLAGQLRCSGGRLG
jgi:release factor glutamine methyltransferase